MTTTLEEPKQKSAVLALDAIRVSKTNPRKHFDVKAQEELAESVKRHGILQPILVRPVNGHYELVAGERRYKAARAASLVEIPSVIRELSDKEALEVMVVENLQRQDLHPLEEAEGYEQLTKTYGYGVEDLAFKVGKSKGYVYARMKLLALCKKARKAFYAGQMTPSVALLIARIPDIKLQEKAMQDVLRGQTGLGMTYQEATNHVQSNYMLRLAGAPFNPKDATLYPAAGSCASCPKRSGNQPELFQDVKSADVCTDPVCFSKKKDLAWQQKAQAAEAVGQKVLSKNELRQVFHYANDDVSYASNYVDLNARCYEDPKNRTYRQLIGKEIQPALARDPSGKIHELVQKKDVAEALKKAGHRWAKDRPGSKSPLQAKADRKRRREEEIRKRVKWAVLNQVVVDLEKNKVPESDTPFWRYMAEGVLKRAWHDSVKDVAKRRGMPKGGDPSAFLKKALGVMSTLQLRAFAVDMVATFNIDDWDYQATLKKTAETFGVDLKKIEDTVRSATQEKKNAGKKAPGGT